MASDLLKTIDFGDGIKRAVAPEWSNVQNKPFETDRFETDTFIPSEWTPDGEVSKAFTDVMGPFFDGATFNCYEVGATLEEITGGAIMTAVHPVGGTLSYDDADGSNQTTIIEDANYKEVAVCNALTVFVTEADNTPLDGDYTGITIPKAGTYILDTWSMQGLTLERLTLKNGTFKRSKETIKQEVLPESLRFGESETGGDTLTWDGNTDGKTVVEVEGMEFCKISDSTPMFNEITTGTMVVTGADGGTQAVPLDASMLVAGDNYLQVADCVVVYSENTDVDGMILPEKGTYFVKMEGTMHVSSLTIDGYNGFITKTIKPLDEKYMPVLTSPSGKKFKITVADDGTLAATEV